MSDKKPIDQSDEPQVDTRTTPTTQPYKDPECPKCGLKMANRMMYCCPHGWCPMRLN